MTNSPKIQNVSPEELQRIQDAHKKEDLESRDVDVKLEDTMIFRGKGARMVRTEEIDFDEDE